MVVTCEHCLKELSTMDEAADAGAAGYMDPITGMRARHRTRDELGHAMYRTSAGRMALCALREKPS